jgi:hypothetical protein
MAACAATQEAIWMRQLLEDLDKKQEGPTILMEDNQGCINLSKNSKYQARTKHIDRKYHFVREKVELNEVKLVYCNTKAMIADILTKPLPTNLFLKFRNLLGMSSD